MIIYIFFKPNINAYVFPSVFPLWMNGHWEGVRYQFSNDSWHMTTMSILGNVNLPIKQTCTQAHTQEQMHMCARLFRFFFKVQFKQGGNHCQKDQLSSSYLNRCSREKRNIALKSSDMSYLQHMRSLRPSFVYMSVYLGKHLSPSLSAHSFTLPVWYQRAHWAKFLTISC